MSNTDSRSAPQADPDVTRAPSESDTSFTSIGPYRLLQKIGEGGMGEVWLAEQTQPIRRQVALKVIKAGMDTAQVIARFEAERQALALMDHPNIAKVFDGGSTAAGRPYFVMEFVRGAPITAYCDRLDTRLRERLELFAALCDGVQHAHQKGIIHRDLKPSNILVSLVGDQPVPRIIDFGIAKATAQQLTNAPMHTEVGAFIGTPEYMSPEQADGGSVDIDTRTDVYSLGMILYELLTGTLPFDSQVVRRGSADTVRHAIREVAPVRPSARVRELLREPNPVSQRCGLPLKKLSAAVRGDLDWITLKAIEKERTRRFDTASALAVDIRSYLQSQPILARRPSPGYRLRKFLQRHRAGATAASLTVLMLLGFVALLLIQSQRLAGERDRATREAATARQVSEFLVSLFGSPTPERTRGAAVTARELLDRGAEQVRKELGDQPEVRTRLLLTMSQAYRALDAPDMAAQLAREAYDLRRSLVGPDSLETAQAAYELGVALYDLRRLKESEQLLREASVPHERLLGRQHADTLSVRQSLAGTLVAEGRWAEAEPQLRELVAAVGQVSVPAEMKLRTFNNFGVVLHQQGKFEEAERFYRLALEESEGVYGPNAPQSLIYATNLSEALEQLGLLPEAEKHAREVLEGRRRVLPVGHRRIANTSVTLASILVQQQHFDEAEPHLREALQTFAKTPAIVDEYVGLANSLFGQVLMSRREYKAAEPYLRTGYEQLLASNASARQRRRAIQRMVDLSESTGRRGEAAEWQRRLREGS